LLDDGYIYKGDLLQDLERYEDAIKAYKKVIDLNCEYDGLYNAMGSSYFELERYDEKSHNELINSHPTPKNDKIQAIKKSLKGHYLLNTTCI